MRNPFVVWPLSPGVTGHADAQTEIPVADVLPDFADAFPFDRFGALADPLGLIDSVGHAAPPATPFKSHAVSRCVSQSSTRTPLIVTRWPSLPHWPFGVWYSQPSDSRSVRLPSRPSRLEKEGFGV